ncbi:hypothetical protein JG687_00017433 [Phytophthora cactorum]|uniref:Necrosis inducing protein n=2 Tax=Phytophthora cactorum TaxID=29920 RepID=A0A8T1TPD5_9STRA|nr:Necrosis inducing protein [Phytophthora cactorum]KAG6945192.1 hypothetical protein JG687_00017433 [Phytophthora cactorum]
MASRRHDWANVVVWIDNSALEPAKILGVSLSKSTDHNSTGTTTLRALLCWFPIRHIWVLPPDYQDLIMWEQLTEEARVALNATDFGKSKVPFNDDNFENTLEKAWPF